MIPAPYLLYLGHSTDFIGIKTSRGLAAFRPDDCVGEFRYDDCPLTLGIPRMTIAEGAAAGAKTLVLGISLHFLAGGFQFIPVVTTPNTGSVAVPPRRLNRWMPTIPAMHSP